MKPTADCKHARLDIDHQQFYDQREYDDAAGRCWKCSGALVPDERPRVTDLTRIGMDDELRKRLAADPEESARILRMMNRPLYVCPPCWEKHLEKCKAEFDRGECRSAAEILAEFKDREFYRRRRRQQIAEVEACVPDCPWRDRLKWWKKELTDG